MGFPSNDVSNESDEISHDRTSGYTPGLQVQEGYVGLFVRLLGLDNSVEERENAVLALWRHSMGTVDSVKEIVMFPGCLNLIVSLLPFDRPATAEAAAGLLRNICAIEEYRYFPSALVPILLRRSGPFIYFLLVHLCKMR